jgi:fatty acid desaturase
MSLSCSYLSFEYKYGSQLLLTSLAKTMASIYFITFLCFLFVFYFLNLVVVGIQFIVNGVFCNFMFEELHNIAMFIE